MLDLDQCRIRESVERNIAPGYTIDDEGKALISQYPRGSEYGVAQSAGAAGERFVGVSLSMPIDSTTLPETYLITLSGTTFTLDHEPLGTGYLYVYDQTDGVEITSGDPANTNEYSLSGSTLTFNSAKDGHDLRIQSRYNATVLEIQMIHGNEYPGGPAHPTTGTVGVILKGDVYTSEFDTAVDWSGDPDVYLGADGRFTTDNTGELVANAHVIHVPDDGYMGRFLGLAIT